MPLQAAFLFAKEIGKFFAVTTLDLLNWITQWRHDIKIFKVSAVDLKTMHFLCISFNKFPNIVKLPFKLWLSRKIIIKNCPCSILWEPKNISVTGGISVWKWTDKFQASTDAKYFCFIQISAMSAMYCFLSLQKAL
jgi:hypothetical protein